MAILAGPDRPLPDVVDSPVPAELRRVGLATYVAEELVAPWVGPASVDVVQLVEAVGVAGVAEVVDGTASELTDVGSCAALTELGAPGTWKLVRIHRASASRFVWQRNVAGGGPGSRTEWYPLFWQVLMIRPTFGSCPSPPVWFIATPQNVESHQYSDQNRFVAVALVRFWHPCGQLESSFQPGDISCRNWRLQLARHGIGSCCLATLSMSPTLTKHSQLLLYASASMSIFFLSGDGDEL